VSDQPDAPGIRCPKCNCRDLRVIQTWHGPGVIKRSRVCRHCGHRFPTRETVNGAAKK